MSDDEEQENSRREWAEKLAALHKEALQYYESALRHRGQKYVDDRHTLYELTRLLRESLGKAMSMIHEIESQENWKVYQDVHDISRRLRSVGYRMSVELKKIERCKRIDEKMETLDVLISQLNAKLAA
jgi:hypothetical protein